MFKAPNNGNTKEESVKLTPEKVKALLEHLESTEQLTNQALINAEVLCGTLRNLLEAQHLVKLILGIKGW